MKKWLLIFFLAVAAGSIYLFLSAKTPVEKVIAIKASISAANRCFLDTASWRKWWPRQYAYRIRGIFYNEVRFSFPGRGEGEQPVSLRIAQVSQDTVLLGWEGALPADVRVEMDTVMKAFRSFVEDNRNIYGVRFLKTMSKDSTLITLSSVEASYPSTDYIYRKIDTLSAYAASRGAKVINYPMMNITGLEAGRFRIMIALSLDKTLAQDGRIVIKRFVPWKMIEGEVKGGDSSVNRALQQLYNFRDDQRLSIMALPFQSLVTDRRKEQDSTKWVTKVCAPIS
jgi:hypothetical protein